MKHYHAYGRPQNLSMNVDISINAKKKKKQKKNRPPLLIFHSFFTTLSNSIQKKTQLNIYVYKRKNLKLSILINYLYFFLSSF